MMRWTDCQHIRTTSN